MVDKPIDEVDEDYFVKKNQARSGPQEDEDYFVKKRNITPPPEPLTTRGLLGAAKTGLVKGFSSLLESYGRGDLGDIAARAVAPPDTPQPLTAEDYERYAQPLTGELHKAGNVPEQYTQTGFSFVPGALVGPGSLGTTVGGTLLKGLFNAGVHGILPGLASEAGGQLTKGTKLEPWARAAGGVVGGAGSSYLASKTAEDILRRQTPKWLTPEQSKEAVRLMQIGQNLETPMPLTYPMAVSHVTGEPVYQETQRMLEHHPLTRGQFQGEMYAIPERMERNVGSELERLGPAAPDPYQLGPKAAEAAQAAIDEPRKILNLGTHLMYEESGKSKVNSQIMSGLEKLAPYGEVKKELRSGIKGAEFSDMTDDSVGFLNQMKIRLGEKAKDAFEAGDSGAGRIYRATEHAVKEAATDASPVYKQALEVQEKVRREVLEPLQNTPLARVANSKETESVIQALFPAGKMAENQDVAIGQAVARLAKQNPVVASQLVRHYLFSTFQDAMKEKRTVGGEAWGPRGWYATIFGKGQQQKNLQAALNALPDGAKRAQAWHELLNVAGASGQRLPIGSPTFEKAAEAAGLARGGRIGSAAKALSAPLKTIQDMVSNVQIARNADELTRIFTDPRATVFRSLTDKPTGGDKLRAILARARAQSTRPIPGILGQMLMR
jgi:hypothetical protein